MPPKIKTTSENILAAAVQLVQHHGAEALNARRLAKTLGCSVQPIFRAFGSMDELKAAVYKEIEGIYNSQMLEGMANNSNGFSGMGIAYINFARNEQNMFKLLFMSDAFKQRNAMEIAGSTEGDDEVIEMISSLTGFDSARAQELYTGIWLTTHGVASLLATNSCHLSDHEIERLLNQSYQGLLYVLKNEMEEV